MNDLKKKIFDLALHQDIDIEKCEKFISEYEEIYPYDMDLFLMKSDFLLKTAKVKEACDIIKIAVERYPYSAVLHEKYGILCMESGEYLEAYKQFQISETIHLIYDSDEDALRCNRRSSEVLEIVKNVIPKLNDFLKPDEIESFLYSYERMTDEQDTVFGYVDSRYRGDVQCVGERFLADGREFFLGAVRGIAYSSTNEKTLKNLRGEFLEAVRSKELSVSESDGDYIIPIAAPVNGTRIDIKCNDESITTRQYWANSFYYYRLKDDSEIKTDSEVWFGNPIKLGHEPKRKRLVLNLFILW